MPEGDPLGTIELDGLEAYGVDMTVSHTSINDWGRHENTMATASHLADPTADFHTYSYLVDDTEVRVYLDGKYLHKVPLYRPQTVDKFFWMFNLAMGGGWAVAGPISGYYGMQIDYIRIYSKDRTP